jgi:hypothetical protein
VTTVAAASSNSVAPGTLGFLVVFGMAVLLFFVFRSMSKHLRKVNAAARQDQAAGSPETRSDDTDAASVTSGPTSPGDQRKDS